MRRSVVMRWGEAPAVYPYHKPFLRTPYDQDRVRLRQRDMRPKTEEEFPRWLEEGIDGTGRGIGLYRSHPLSRLKGNVIRDQKNIPKIYRAMMHGYVHASGARLYYKGGKVPQPHMHPLLTGEPCPVYGWKVLDHDVIRKFEAPTVDKDKARYKPYVASHEQLLKEVAAAKSGGGNDPNAPPPASAGAIAPSSSGKGASPPAAGGAKKDDNKPLLKRLFFWR